MAGNMFGKTGVGHVFGITLATLYSTMLAAGLRSMLPGLHWAIWLLIWAILWIAFYVVGVWMRLVRKPELDRKIPVSSKELRKRRKAFYDRLATRGSSELPGSHPLKRR